MRKSSIIILLPLVVAFLSCNDYDDINIHGDYVKIAQSQINANAIGDSFNIDIDASDRWTLTETGGGWWTAGATLGEKGSTKLKIVVDVNTTTNTRESVLKIKCGEEMAECKITQQPGGVPTISTFERHKDSYSFKIQVSSKLEVKRVGICYSTDGTTPDTSSQTCDAVRDNGNYSATIENTDKAATYTVRAFAVNEVGTGYSIVEVIQPFGIPSLDDNNPPNKQ